MATTTTTTPAAQIAATTRAAIKAARNAGNLTLPSGAKIGVRSHNFAGGYAVGIAVTGVDQAWAITTRDTEYGTGQVPTADAKQIGDTLTAILAAAANGRCWGDVTIAGLAVDGGTIKPRH